MRGKALFFILAVIFLSTFVHAQAYSLNMRDISYRMINDSANAVFVGDSITAVTSTPRIMYGAVRTWHPNAWRGMITQGTSGVGDQGTGVSNEPTTWASKLLVMPGQPFFSGTSGWNMNMVSDYRFFSDFPGGGTMYRMYLTPASFSEPWMQGVPFTLRFFYLAHPNHTDVSFQVEMLNGSKTGYHSVSLKGPEGIAWKSMSLPPSSGEGVAGIYVQGTPFVNESLSSNQYFRPLGLRIYRSDISTGLQLGEIGNGGYTTRSHTTQGEMRQIGSVMVNTSYSDEALRAWIAGNELNTFIIWLGQNSAYDEWDGLTIRNYSSNIRMILQRYTSIYSQARPGAEAPYFILVSTYSTDTNATRHLQIAQALENITRAQSSIFGLENATIGFVDLRQKVEDLHGSWEMWNSTYLEDGIHPNQAGSIAFASYVWEEITRAVTPLTGISGSFSFSAQSHTVEVLLPEEGSALFINRDMYSQRIVLIDTDNALVFGEEGRVFCFGVECSSEFSANIDSDYELVALNEFVLSEISRRLHSPFEIVSPAPYSKTVHSSLNRTVSFNSVFYIPHCASITSVFDELGQIKQTFSLSDFTCVNATSIQLNALSVEPGDNTRLVFRRFPLRLPSNVSVTNLTAIPAEPK